jgi:DNA-binding response OmpR family regulator
MHEVTEACTRWPILCICYKMKNLTKEPEVLIIDDDEGLCILLKAYLKRTFDVHIEHTLTEANEYLLTHECRLLFLDNGLPDGKGVEFITTIRSRNEHTQVVFMTGDVSATIKDRALQAGAVHFIAKPFKLSQVGEIVHFLFPDLSAA